MSAKHILVTGSAGFIGFHLTKSLLEQGHSVVGIDNLNPYYSVQLKQTRNAILRAFPKYSFIQLNLADRDGIAAVIRATPFETIFHLGAQAGVRYSLDHPDVYLESNIQGTLSVLEGARFAETKPHLVLASSSSVYGLSQQFPLREDDPADRPVALYGATKRANELMAHSYAYLFGLRTTMVRFFTVYGPWGRPDMALFRFAENIMKGEPLELFNGGDMIRDFTYIDDVVEGLLALDRHRGTVAEPRGTAGPNFDIFNLGCGQPRPLMDFIGAVEHALQRKAKLKSLPFQAGDLHKTFADTSKLKLLTGFSAKTSIEEGVSRFVEWYLDYNGIAER